MINLLPLFAYLDMIDVVNDLKDSGYNFDISWFDPFLNLDSHIMVMLLLIMCN
jgi:uncharacterized protein (DUF2126 family)